LQSVKIIKRYYFFYFNGGRLGERVVGRMEGRKEGRKE